MINFCSDNAVFQFDKTCKVININKYCEDANFINMQELQAINEKCKELRWLV